MRASRSKRFSHSRCRDRWRCGRLSATSSDVLPRRHRARKTSPMPPAPISRTGSNEGRRDRANTAAMLLLPSRSAKAPAEPMPLEELVEVHSVEAGSPRGLRDVAAAGLEQLHEVAALELGHEALLLRAEARFEIPRRGDRLDRR